MPGLVLVTQTVSLASALNAILVTANYSLLYQTRATPGSNAASALFILGFISENFRASQPETHPRPNGQHLRRACHTPWRDT
jgi:hypothetical protein